MAYKFFSMTINTAEATNNPNKVFEGAGGTVFENSVQTTFITTLSVLGGIPGLLTDEVTKVAYQTTRLDFRTEDLDEEIERG